MFMNRKILLSLLCLLFLFSCKKEHQEENETPRYPVRFDLNGFTQTQQPIDGAPIKTNSLTANTTTDTIPVNQLFYFVFKESGALVAQKTVSKTSSGFGVFTDDLPAGNYVVYFLGSSTNLDITANNGISLPNVVISPDGNAGSPLYGYNSWGDTFYKKIPVTVTSAGIVQTVQMERISAQLIFNIEDAIPANIGKIEVTYNEPISFYFYTSNNPPNKHYISRSLSSADVGSTNIKLYGNTLNTLTPITFSISYFATGSNSPVDTKTVTVTSQPNKRTVISGKLFTGNSVFDITYDTNWDTVTVGY